MKIIGHRGAKGLAPENTKASIRVALDSGVDEIEVDVRVTKDNAVILNHDNFIRVGTKKYVIRKHTYKELLSYKPDIITLNEAFDAVNQVVPLLVEVKPREPLEPIIAVVTARLAGGLAVDKLLIGSFSQRLLKRLHQSFPETTMVVIEKWSVLRAVYRANRLQTNRLSLNQRLLFNSRVQRLAKRGFAVYPYTMNDPQKAAHWKKHGLTGVVTDYPNLFRRS